MKESIRFSIITCTWNSAETLRETIDSVLSQKYGTVEHIFVDGGSTDGTLELIAELVPDAIVLNDVRGGISHAMNEGVSVATGDVFAHLHSDDYFLSPNVLGTVAAAFALNPSRGWAYGRIRLLRNGVLESDDCVFRSYSYFRYVSGRVSISHPAVFMRRDLFQKIGGFDTKLKYAMDIDYWLRLGRNNQPIQIDDALTAFREHAGSLSTANKIKAREEEWRVRKNYFASEPVAAMIYMLRYVYRMRRLRRELACPV